MALEIKDKIRNIRELKNYTQNYLADQLGISQAAYSKIEKGITDLSFNKLEEIAVILEVTLEDIIQFDSDIYLNNKNSEAISAASKTNIDLVQNLYKDKIFLLEKLLNRTDLELKRYRDKFGMF
ncbi:transcriptional regulator with XRE-family HTH domain [Flavobacterium sp. HSC-32F16]|uniref:helix-turn-helix transcriptional regulator n=1 Tax=Flavobacterium sp. HSC-32F16 TaxID=2910964 RepID=UPI0020A328AA|nr:helix-turn-helix transcriptional regulator [Flavobacterium sp. HSC-32F16]MCP2025426.1 transcriptional regulator with XRE-family HTH domain [Flavobacterium sp. HSC-32F16]